jgi:hypothetical protein
LEEQVALYGFNPPHITIHTQNAGAKPKMVAAAKKIYYLATQR